MDLTNRNINICAKHNLLKKCTYKYIVKSMYVYTIYIFSELYKKYIDINGIQDISISRISFHSRIGQLT